MVYDASDPLNQPDSAEMLRAMREAQGTLYRESQPKRFPDNTITQDIVSLQSIENSMANKPIPIQPIIPNPPTSIDSYTNTVRRGRPKGSSKVSKKGVNMDLIKRRFLKQEKLSPKLQRQFEIQEGLAKGGLPAVKSYARIGAARLAKSYQTLKQGKRAQFQTRRAQRAARGLSQAFIMGAPGYSSYSRIARGRPVGSFKYGMPIAQYKQMLRERAAQVAVAQEMTREQLAGKGYSPEQAQYIEQQQVQRMAAPQMSTAPIQQIQAPQYPGQPQPQRKPISFKDLRQFSQREKQIEVLWRKNLAEQFVSPNTLRIMNRVKEIQQMGKMADIEQQRRIRERKMLAEMTNILSTPSIFGPGPHIMDLTGISDDNILKAPNLFAQGQNIMQTRRPSILQTREAGNNLFF